MATESNLKTYGPVKRIGPTDAEYFGIKLETDEEFAAWGRPYQDKPDVAKITPAE